MTEQEMAALDAEGEAEACTAQAQAEYDSWLDEQKLHVSYFSAVWCGPCKMFKPAFEDVVKEFGDQIEVSYYDVDQHREVASAKMISAVPTVIMTKGTEDVFRNSGVMSKAALKEQIEKHK